MLSGPVTTHPDAPSPGMPSAGRRPRGRGRDGQGPPALFSGHPEGLEEEPKALGTGYCCPRPLSHSWCPGPWHRFPGWAGVNSRGDWNLSTSTLCSCSLSACLRFRQTRTPGRNLNHLATGVHDSAAPPLALPTGKCFKQTLNKKEKQQDPCTPAGRWAVASPGVL